MGLYPCINTINLISLTKFNVVINKIIIMKSFFTVLIVFCFCAFACKKKYTCNCTTAPLTQTTSNTNTITAGQSTGYMNQVHYSIKASDESAAQTKCEAQYENSGYVVNGMKCTVY